MYGVIGSTSRKLKKLYGTIGSTTRKIKKVYGVVGGVTRLIFSGGADSRICAMVYGKRQARICTISEGKIDKVIQEITIPTGDSSISSTTYTVNFGTNRNYVTFHGDYDGTSVYKLSGSTYILYGSVTHDQVLDDSGLASSYFYVKAAQVTTDGQYLIIAGSGKTSSSTSIQWTYVFVYKYNGSGFTYVNKYQLIKKSWSSCYISPDGRTIMGEIYNNDGAQGCVAYQSSAPFSTWTQVYKDTIYCDYYYNQSVSVPTTSFKYWVTPEYASAKNTEKNYNYSQIVYWTGSAGTIIYDLQETSSKYYDFRGIAESADGKSVYVSKVYFYSSSSGYRTYIECFSVSGASITYLGKYYISSTNKTVIYEITTDNYALAYESSYNGGSDTSTLTHSISFIALSLSDGLITAHSSTAINTSSSISEDCIEMM